jgi:predicted amidohydrolase YtcJ
MARRLEEGHIALVNGRVFTADPDRPSATALGIRGGLLAYVGDDVAAAQAAAGPGADIVDLAGRTATPGLIDAHCHPMLYGEQLLGIDLTAVQSVAELLRLLRARAATTPAGEALAGWGYYQQSLAEGRLPTLAELDDVAPAQPVALIHRSGHEMLTNSAMLRLAGYERGTPDPVGGYLERDARGELTGRLVENAMEPVGRLRPEPGPERYAAWLRTVTERMLAYGITSVTEANLTSPVAMRAYQAAQTDASAPRVRFNVMLGHWEMLEPAVELGVQTGFGDRWLRCGAMKFFIDGTEGMRTAKLSAPFADDPANTGMWMFAPDEFQARVLRAHRAGWQCATHAIGDAAIELTLDAYRAAQTAAPRPDARHRVEHASLLRPDLIERFAHEGVVPVPGARFASNDYSVLRARFGVERLRWYQPWNALLERNVPVCVSSDAPVQSPDPALNLLAIVTSRAESDEHVIMQPDERISLAEALTAYTRHGAWATHEERRKGMLRPGLLGDVTVFDRDLFALDPAELGHVKAALTVVDGVVVWRG